MLLCKTETKALWSSTVEAFNRRETVGYQGQKPRPAGLEALSTSGRNYISSRKSHASQMKARTKAIGILDGYGASSNRRAYQRMQSNGDSFAS